MLKAKRTGSGIKLAGLDKLAAHPHWIFMPIT